MTPEQLTLSSLYRTKGDDVMNLTKSLVIFITGMGLFASACTKQEVI